MTCLLVFLSKDFSCSALFIHKGHFFHYSLEGAGVDPMSIWGKLAKRVRLMTPELGRSDSAKQPKNSIAARPVGANPSSGPARCLVLVSYSSATCRTSGALRE